MGHSFDTIGYRDMANHINDACAWLADHGVDFPRTRMGEYKRHLNEMADYWEQGRIDDLLQRRDYRTLINSCHEAGDLAYIYKGLSSLTGNSLTSKLREFIKGPASSKGENASSSNRGRNIAFELYMAARLVTAGFSVDLTSDADLIVSVLHHEVFVECKRPQQNHQVNSNIKGAITQLQRRYPSAKCPEQARGIIALSIAKVFNPDMYLVTADTPTSLSDKLAMITASFLNEFDRKWRNPADYRTIGVLAYLGAPAEITTQNLFTNCHEFAVKTTFTSNDGLDVLSEIGRRIHPTL